MDPKAGSGEEDDCVDSGAETGGSDYSHMSSTSSELSVEEAQDPFLVSVHIIADPGESRPLQEAIDKVLAWIHPDLQLFRVSERRASRRRRKAPKVAQPALAVVLFLQEEYGEEQILQLHRTLQRPPWRHHHTERVPSRFLPYLPCSQEFFTLAPGTPLWAIRPVHYGKEIVRFTIYCRHDNYADILKFYELILRRSPSQRKTDFCIFPIFSSLDVDIQFSLKRLPCDQTPVPTDSSVLEFRVKDIGELVPLLPNPCRPISEGRWQTEDHDGNKILLQMQQTHSCLRTFAPTAWNDLLQDLHMRVYKPGTTRTPILQTHTRRCRSVAAMPRITNGKWHRGYAGSALNPAELTTPQSRRLGPRLLRVPLHRARPLAAARSPRWTLQTWGSARQACLPGSRRTWPDQPAALPASPGLSREASPCFVCPRETPPRPPQLNHCALQTQTARDRGHRSGGTATSSPSMT
nr:protein FAM124A isoform X2 [Globicephala melas]